MGNIISGCILLLNIFRTGFSLTFKEILLSKAYDNAFW